MFIVQCPASDRRVNPFERSGRSYKPVAAKCEFCVRVAKRAKRIGSLCSLMPNHFLCPPSIIDCVIRLHAWDDTELSEPWNVSRCDVLRVLNTEPAIARTVFLCDALENVELCGDRPITNGVADHLTNSFVPLRCHPLED